MAVGDGGSAFPGAFSGHCEIDGHASPCGCYVDKGMTLRDFFAASALMGMLSGNAYSLSQDISKKCYEHADQMLQARVDVQKEG